MEAGAKIKKEERQQRRLEAAMMAEIDPVRSMTLDDVGKWLSVWIELDMWMNLICGC